MLQLGLLVASAYIPRTYIQENMEESADYLLEKEVFFYANSSDVSAKIDRYADSILLGIAYSYDSDAPISSVMRSSYYHTDTENENVNLKLAVSNELLPNTNYTRYWHGSIAIFRPLLTIFNIEQIYILNAVILFVLFIALLVLTYKKLGIGALICLLISGIMTSLWYVPLSLEYIWTILLMCIAGIISLFIYKCNNCGLFMFFLTIGSFTAYFDFLTTETLTLLLPLVIVTIARHKDNMFKNSKDYISHSAYISLFWLLGYTLAWIAKWSLASIVLHENVFSTALSQAAVRVNGETSSLTGFTRYFAAIARNISCLFPFSMISKNRLAFCLLTFIIVFTLYFLIKKQKDCVLANHLLLLALIPYIRFLLLSNHSYVHYFFTFRAQFATIFCIGLAFIYGTDRDLLKKEWRKLWGHKKKK